MSLLCRSSLMIWSDLKLLGKSPKDHGATRYFLAIHIREVGIGSSKVLLCRGRSVQEDLSAQINGLKMKKSRDDTSESWIS